MALSRDSKQVARYSIDSKTPNTKVGRVLDVILDSSNPRYSELGGPNSIGAIVFIPDGSIAQESLQNLPVAFPLDRNMKVYPVKNEIVPLISMPSPASSEISSDRKLYYGNPVGVWNHPQHNAVPKKVDPNTGQADLGSNFEELSTINPLRPSLGDVLLEGRQGQSIRFSGAAVDSADGQTVIANGKPFIIISNGQIETDNGFEPILEDINEDNSSIYMLSDHSAPLIASNEKRDSYGQDSPEDFDSYIGSQILLNSDRVVLNSREDDILMSGNTSIGLSSPSINLDADNSFIVSSDSIKFGENAEQPILKGDDFIKLIEDLLNEIRDLGNKIAIAGQQPSGPFPTLIDAGTSLSLKVDTLLNNINSTKSTKTFTE